MGRDVGPAGSGRSSVGHPAPSEHVLRIPSHVEERWSARSRRGGGRGVQGRAEPRRHIPLRGERERRQRGADYDHGGKGHDDRAGGVGGEQGAPCPHEPSCHPLPHRQRLPERGIGPDPGQQSPYLLHLLLFGPARRWPGRTRSYCPLSWPFREGRRTEIGLHATDARPERTFTARWPIRRGPVAVPGYRAASRGLGAGPPRTTADVVDRSHADAMTDSPGRDPAGTPRICDPCHVCCLSAIEVLSRSTSESRRTDRSST